MYQFFNHCFSPFDFCYYITQNTGFQDNKVDDYRVNQTETVINNIMDAIEKGVVTNTTTKRLKENEAKLEDLERKIIIEKSKTSVQLTEKEIRQFYEKALHMEAKMLIHYLVKQIVLYDDKIEIQFYHPLTTSSDESQGFSFCSKQKHMVYKTKRMPTIKYKMQIEMFV